MPDNLDRRRIPDLRPDLLRDHPPEPAIRRSRRASNDWWKKANWTVRRWSNLRRSRCERAWKRSAAVCLARNNEVHSPNRAEHRARNTPSRTRHIRVIATVLRIMEVNPARSRRSRDFHPKRVCRTRRAVALSIIWAWTIERRPSGTRNIVLRASRMSPPGSNMCAVRASTMHTSPRLKVFLLFLRSALCSCWLRSGKRVLPVFTHLQSVFDFGRDWILVFNLLMIFLHHAIIFE